jgi:hypothetical protein
MQAQFAPTTRMTVQFCTKDGGEARNRLSGVGGYEGGPSAMGSGAQGAARIIQTPSGRLSSEGETITGRILGKTPGCGAESGSAPDADKDGA